MILKGLIDDVFGNSTIFRGYATLRMLAMLSKPNTYQREINDAHIEEIEKYMKTSSFRFFPELIFSLQFKDQNVIDKIKYEKFPRGGLRTIDGIRITKGIFSYEKKIENEASAKVVSLDIPDNLVENKILYRIDGNHRLSVIDKMLEEEKQNGVHGSVIDNAVPFSILLQSESPSAQKYESAYFYLINAKAKSLTSEENLRTIFSNPNFDDIEKKSLLEIDDVSKINDIVEILSNNATAQLKIIKDKFNSEIYSLALDIYHLVPNASIESISNALNYINSLYEDNKIPKSLQFIYLSLIAYKAEHSDKDLKKFIEWLEATKVNQTNFGDVKHLLSSYEQNFNKNYKVFVAMPYVSFARVNDFNRLFKEVFEEISNKQPYKLELIPIMRFRGESQRIDQRLIKCIKECDIFIADLSECNSNVIFEIGLAEGNDKPMILIKEDNDKANLPFDEVKLDVKKQVPFDMDKLQWIPYSSTGYYNAIKTIMKNNIPEILINRYGLIKEIKK